MSTITVDWRKLEGRLFDKFVEKLSGDHYKELIQTEPEFEAKVNGHPFTPTRTIHDVRPKKIGGELGAQIAADQAEAERPERELNEQITAMVEKDLAEKYKKLRSRLDSGLGLDRELCVWMDLPPNIPVMPIPAAGFAGAAQNAILVAAKKFMNRHEAEGRFNENEQQVLYKTLIDACGTPGRMFDPRSDVSWEAVYKTCLMAGRIRPQRTQPVEAPKPKKVNLENVLPSQEELKKQYRTVPVVQWRGKWYARRDLDQMLGDDYRTLLRETGFKGDGPLLLNTNDLSRRGGS
jgi:hypothetical protein